MKNTYLSLDNASCLLPDGRTLFANITATLDDRHTGLVGRNGVGKTLLARMLARQIVPSSGRITGTGKVYYLAQQVELLDAVSVAHLANVHLEMEALTRIESGSTCNFDFETLNDRWDIRQRLQVELNRNGLGHLLPNTPANQLSGGEAMRVALIGATLSDADVLILDEPTNHLDRPSRLALTKQLQQWNKGLLVISHDRALLNTMDRIIELTPSGLNHYGGNYSFYEECKTQERKNAVAQLETHKHERKRELIALREQRERVERRHASGQRQGRDANQAKILLGRQKERSESSKGKLLQQQQAARETLNRQVREAAEQLSDETKIAVHNTSVNLPSSRKVLELNNAELPYGSDTNRILTLSLYGQQRVGLRGPNGCGKSTLLKLLAGQLKPITGQCSVYVKSAYLDQHLSSLRPEQSVIQQLLNANSKAVESELRTKLNHLGLDAQKISIPCHQLSGGERIKAALAGALYADEPAQLLLLDEPSNHLDLPSIQALETMLCDYQGALMIASHDEAFMKTLKLTHSLDVTAKGWQWRQE